MQPAPSAPQPPSPAPITTLVPFFSPHASAAAAVTSPTTRVLSTASGNTSRGTFTASRIASDHVKVFMSKALVPPASE